MLHTLMCRRVQTLFFSLLCLPSAVVGVRQEVADELPPQLARMVAHGKDLSEFSENVDKNARLQADELGSVQSLAELTAGSNITATLTGYTPPCPWKNDLKNDGEVVGSGSFGEVFTATVKCADFPVAIKKLRGSTLAKVTAEVKIMDKFSSANFIKVYGMGKSTKPNSNVYYILMEAAQGGSFETFVKKAGGTSKPAYQIAVHLFLGALEGVVEMHRMGYHHRDIKPDNILVSGNCGAHGTCRGKLADLGESCTPPACKGIHGTPYYMAPELLRHELNSRRNDVWSMGIVLFRILNKGKLPQKFRDSSTQDALFSQIIKFKVSDEMEYFNMPETALKDLLAKMLNPDVKKRLSSETALDMALRAVKDCGILEEMGAVCSADATKDIQFLPSCWGGSSKGDWQPTSAVKKPAEEIRVETEVVEERRIVNGEVPNDLVTHDVFEVDANEVTKYSKTFSAGKLGVIVIEDTGAIDKVTGGQAKDKEVQEGWFVDKICGLPYDFKLLQAAAAAACGDPFTIQFREPLFTEQPLPEDPDDEVMKMQTRHHTEGAVKVFAIKRPGSNIGIGYIFNNLDVVSEQGVVQKKWAKLNTKYTRGMGIPLKPGDEIIKVNNQPWDDIKGDPQFLRDAASGKLGPLTFLYLAD